MGGGTRSTDTSDARAAAKKLSGTPTFHHHAATVSKPRSSWTVANCVNPKSVAGDKSPHAGQVMRECIISAEHPDPTPIAVLFDVTGSMGSVPKELQKKLGTLHALLAMKGFCADPQIMFGAIGDCNSDTLPLQIGQFESDEQMDEQLESLVLEGGGGGHGMETYELAGFYLARHTFLEPYEKFGKKGYAFIIGDERYYPSVRAKFIRQYTDSTPEADVPSEDMWAEVMEKYHLFFIWPHGSKGHHFRNSVMDPATAGSWGALLGERALNLDDPALVAELIATTVGIIEGSVTLDDGLDAVKDAGASADAAAAVGRALATVGANAGAAVATSTGGDLPGLD